MQTFFFTLPWLWLLAPLPWLLWRLNTSAKRQQSAIYVPHFQHWSEKAPAPTQANKTTVSVLLILAWLSFLTALTQPHIFGEARVIPHTGRDIMLAVDLSESMEIDDMQINDLKVNRFTMVQSLLDDFIQGRQGDRLGLILFADTAYLQAPLTYDLKTLRLFLQQSQTGMIGEATAITDAVGLAAKQFSQADRQQRVLLLMTDGSNTSGNLTKGQALDVAKHHQMTIYSVAIGQPDSIDQGYLRQLATQSNGQFFVASDANALQSVYSMVNRLEPVEADYQTITPQHAVFHWFVLIAVTSLVFAHLLSRGWRR